MLEKNVKLRPDCMDPFGDLKKHFYRAKELKFDHTKYHLILFTRLSPEDSGYEEKYRFPFFFAPAVKMKRLHEPYKPQDQLMLRSVKFDYSVLVVMTVSKAIPNSFHFVKFRRKKIRTFATLKEPFKAKLSN